MKKLKIDFVIGKMSSGGAVANLANHFDGLNYEIRIITFLEGDHYELNRTIQRIRFHKKGIVKPAIIRGFFKLFQFYFKVGNRPDIISSHIGMMGYATIPVSRIYGIKVIVSEHFNHVHQPDAWPRRILWNILYRYANAVTILTNFDLDFFQSRNKKVVVMENPCSFRINRNPLKSREKVILAVGNLDRYDHKGFDNLIEIAANVLIHRKDWKLKFVGGGEVGHEVLRKLSKEHGISEKVIFTGFRRDVKALMSNAEIFVLSSRREGLPMVLLEALSQGMACISYDCVTGPAQILIHNENGLLIDDQNKLAMKKGLEELMNNDMLRTKFRKAGPKTLDKFSIEKVGEKWEKLMQEILQNTK